MTLAVSCVSLQYGSTEAASCLSSEVVVVDGIFWAHAFEPSPMKIKLVTCLNCNINDPRSTIFIFYKMFSTAKPRKLCTSNNLSPYGTASLQVGLLSLMASTLAEKNEGFQALHLQICSVLAQVLPVMREMATATPYTFSNQPAPLPKPAQMARQDSSDSVTLQTTTKSPRRVKKRRSDQLAKAPPKALFAKKRSNSISSLAVMDVKPAASSTARARAMTRSISPQASLHVASAASSEKFVSPTQGNAGNFTLGFQLPPEVLILPILEAEPSEGKEVGGGGGAEGEKSNTQWDFNLLSEGEVSVPWSPRL